MANSLTNGVIDQIEEDADHVTGNPLLAERLGRAGKHFFFLKATATNIWNQIVGGKQKIRWGLEMNRSGMLWENQNNFHFMEIVSLSCNGY